MAGFTESNITLDFPTPHWFRFEKSESYSQVYQSARHQHPFGLRIESAKNVDLQYYNIFVKPVGGIKSVHT